MANFASVIKYFPTPKEGFITTLGSSILSGAVTIPLNSTSGLTNGDVFVGLIEPGLTNQQCFTGTVDTAGNQITGVVWTTGTNVAHSAGVTIVDYVTSTTVGMISKGVLKHANQDGSLTNAAVKAALGITADPTGSWNLLDGGAPTVSSVTANGNRSYTINFASDYSTTLSPGMRLKTTRTVAAPTYMGGAFNGSSHYFTKTTPSGTLGTVTNNFTLMGWVELTAYGTVQTVCGRADSTPNNGIQMRIETTGQIGLLIWSGGTANYRIISSYQSLPLNKKVHVAASWTSGTVVIYFDGVSVPVTTAGTGGTAPTTAGTGGDWSIGRAGAYNAQYFTGYISGVGAFDAVLSAATIRSYMSQKLLGSETNCIGAWALNNNGTDDSTAGNTVTATNSVGYTARSPYGTQADGTISSTLDYAIISNIATTAVTVQVPEGCTIPTTGGILGVSYATVKTPYGFPGQRGKWQISSISLTNQAQLTPTSATWYNVGSHQLSVPVGSWTTTIEGNVYIGESGGTLITANATLSKANNTQDNLLFTSTFTLNAGAGAAANVNIGGGYSKTVDVETSAIQVYYLNIMSTSLTPPTLDLNSANAIIQATNAYL
jgi:hypothetical protein